jgi:hypothetical protein
VPRTAFCRARSCAAAAIWARRSSAEGVISIVMALGAFPAVTRGRLSESFALSSGPQHNATTFPIVESRLWRVGVPTSQVYPNAARKQHRILLNSSACALCPRGNDARNECHGEGSLTSTKTVRNSNTWAYLFECNERSAFVASTDHLPRRQMWQHCNPTVILFRMTYKNLKKMSAGRIAI